MMMTMNGEHLLFLPFTDNHHLFSCIRFFLVVALCCIYSVYYSTLDFQNGRKKDSMSKKKSAYNINEQPSDNTGETIIKQTKKTRTYTHIKQTTMTDFFFCF